MEHSESIANLAVALAQAQAELPSVPLDAYNRFNETHYATLKKTMETARPVLAKYGLAVTQIVISSEDRVGIETVLMHSSGEWISNVATVPTAAEKGKSAAQVVGSTISYLRRYAYAAIVGLYTDEDTDGNAPAQASKQPKPAPAKAKPAGSNGNKEVEIVTIPAGAKLSELEGPQLYAIQNGGPDKLGLNPKHFENRWKKRFGVKALKEITATVAEFMKRMADEDVPGENRSVKQEIDKHLAERELDIEDGYEAA